MDSKYYDFRCNINEEQLAEIACGVKKGKLVLFPTETVYGIGANALDETAVKRIFEAKGRASDNPLIVHICSIEMLSSIAENIGEIEKELMQRFWPGPLTIILKRKKIIPNIVTAGLDTVGVRFPQNIIARKLIEMIGIPIAAPSANISGRPSGTKVEDIMQELSGKVDYIVNGGLTQVGLESTVVKVEDNRICILRPGKITKEQLESVVDNVEVDRHILQNVDITEPVTSPGMKYRHYAPNTKCMMVYSKKDYEMIKKINDIIAEYGKEDVVLLAKNANINKYIAKYKLNMGSNLEEIAKNIYTLLRKADLYNKKLVIIEGVETQGLGLAINNRLLRACEYNYIEI